MHKTFDFKKYVEYIGLFGDNNQKGIWISCVADVCRRKYKDTATCGIHNQKRS